MNAREDILNLLLEIDGLRMDLRALSMLESREIETKFHDAVVNALKSIVARAENMESNMEVIYGNN